MIRLLISLSLLLATSLPSFAHGKDGYLFTSFHEPSTDGLRFLWSEDALHWDSIPGLWLVPEKGKVLRDPSIAAGGDGTFHLVWTTQWKGNKGFGYAHSRDLKHWEEVREIEIMKDLDTDNVWAPELFYDEEQGQYLIIWSSAIPEAEYTDADRLGTNKAQRMYYTVTRDFKTFTKPARYYDPGFNSIDGFLLKRAEKDYVLIVKDNRKPGFSNLFCVFSDSPYGPFHSPSQTFGRTYSEGPCAIPWKDGWLIYFDQYKPQEYNAVFTRDFKSFVPMKDSIALPPKHKHGTIIRVQRPQDLNP